MTRRDSVYAERLTALREELARATLDGFVVPLTDEHMSEYVGSYAQRLRWLTGFSGSAGSAAVLTDAAAMFVDGRYTLQVRDQVSADLFAYRALPDETVADWLAESAPDGARIGFDPWLHTPGWVEAASAALKPRGQSLVPVQSNPVDAVWDDQPAPSLAPIAIHADDLAGQRSADKRAALGKTLAGAGADAAVIAALDSVAWLFNIRGSDIAHTPVARAFALLYADGKAALFTEPEKVTPALTVHLGPDVEIFPRSALADIFRRMAGQTVWIDPETCVVGLFDLLEHAGATLLRKADPCALPKARKNAAEIAGTKAAHLRDGAALCRFLHWLDMESPAGTVDELSADAKLLELRQATNQLRDVSFPAITGAGPNGAIVHYRSTRETNRVLQPGELFLVDSGGQYADGTTDVTRTIVIGTPDADQRRHFTLVLKGHIALATARFPKGTSGQQLDVLARLPLWSAGLDYDHGTGHGVGSYLSVHEGPQRIAKRGAAVALEPGMICSNEPGYYKTGTYGIRIENLVLVVEAVQVGDEREMLGFETLTLAPIDRRLIDSAILTPAEIAWIDSYHARVRESLSGQLSGEVAGWLEAATAPL